MDGSYGCGCEVSPEEDLDGGCLEDWVVGRGGGVCVWISFGIVVGLCIGDFIVVHVVFIFIMIRSLWLMIDQRTKGIRSRSFKRGHDEGWLTKDEIEECRIVLSHMCQIHGNARLVIHIVIVSTGSPSPVRICIGAVGSREIHGHGCVAVNVRVVAGCSSMHS